MQSKPINRIKSALLFTSFAFTLQACAGGYGNGSAVTTNTENAGTEKTSAQKPETSQTEATQNVFKVVTGAVAAYAINGAENPVITLKRGATYTFELKATGHPFWIKTKNSTGTANAFEAGVTGNGKERGTLTFAVPADAPALLHYNCQVHDMMNGAIHIID